VKFVSDFIDFSSATLKTMFDSYKQDYDDHIAKIMDGLGKMSQDDKKVDVSQIHKAFKEAEKTVKQLEMDAKSNSERRKEVQGLKENLKMLSQQFDVKLADMHRKGLLGEAAGQKAIQNRLQATEGKIQEGTDMVNNATRLALETEEIGNDIVKDLHAQREVIQRTKANVAVVGQELDQANKTVKEIEKPQCSMM